MVLGRWISYWEGNFSVAMFNFGRVRHHGDSNQVILQSPINTFIVSSPYSYPAIRCTGWYLRLTQGSDLYPAFIHVLDTVDGSEIQLSPVKVGSLSHYLRRVSAPSQVVIARFQPSTVSASMVRNEHLIQNNTQR